MSAGSVLWDRTWSSSGSGSKYLHDDGPRLQSAAAPGNVLRARNAQDTLLLFQRHERLDEPIGLVGHQF
jgi:hypothetical protein